MKSTNYNAKGFKSWNEMQKDFKSKTETFGTNGERDHRGRLIVYDETGNRRLHKPKGSFDEAFQTQSISWVVTVIDVNSGKLIDCVFASGQSEKELRKNRDYKFQN